MAQIGNIINGKYEILKLIGSGGMAKVYLAMDINLNKQWAIKEIEKKCNSAHADIFLKSAIDEANMMKKLDHPGLPRIVDIIDEEESIYVIMDYIEGETLNDVLVKKGKIPQELVVKWAKEICEVLDYLHTRDKPIIYRDMKPSNIILQPNGNIKLIDFGIAREYKERNISDTTNLGTKGYAAPERFALGIQSDARTDIYGLGVTMYHLITGKNPCQPPYEIYPIRYWDSDFSTGIETIIIKCTKQNPDDRYGSCAELLYMLNHYEKIDDKYIRKQKIKIGVFIASLLMMITGLLVGIGFKLLQVNFENSDYNSRISIAKHASDYHDKVNNYIKAIEIRPKDILAYMGLVMVLKEDGTFTPDEEKLLLKAINDNYNVLSKNKEYYILSYEIGKLYWNYYEYGKSVDNEDNQVTRMISSIQWFDDVCSLLEQENEYYVLSNIYSKIGHFNKDINLKVIEACDKGMYSMYFETLQELLTETQKETSEIVKLEAYRLCINSIEIYSNKFKSEGISYREILNLSRQVQEEVSNIIPTTEKTKMLKDTIEGRIQNAFKSINSTFL